MCSGVWRLETKRSVVSSRLLTFFIHFHYWVIPKQLQLCAVFELLPCIFAVGHWKYSLCVWIHFHVYLSWYGRHIVVVVVWQWAYVHFCRLRQPRTKWHDGELKCHNIFATQQRAVVGTMRKSLKNMAILLHNPLIWKLLKLIVCHQTKLYANFRESSDIVSPARPITEEIISSINYIGKRRHSRAVNEVKLRQNWKAQLVGRGVDS